MSGTLRSHLLKWDSFPYLLAEIHWAIYWLPGQCWKLGLQRLIKAPMSSRSPESDVEGQWWKPPTKEYLLAASDTQWDGEGKWHIKERNERRENSRVQRGCGLDRGLNQLHEEWETYKGFGSVVGTPWCSATLALRSMLHSLKRDTGHVPLVLCQLHLT